MIGIVRCRVIDELVFDYFAVAGPEVAHDVRGGIGGWFSAGFGYDHTLAVIKAVVSVNKGGGVMASVGGFQKEWGKLGEELVASDASGCELTLKAHIGLPYGGESVISIDVKGSHDSG